MTNLIPTDGSTDPTTSNAFWRARGNCQTPTNVTAYTVTAKPAAAGTWDVDNDKNRVPVTAGATVTVSGTATLTAPSGRTGRIACEWLNSTGGLISAPSDSEPLVPGSPVNFSTDRVVPATAQWLRLILRVENGQSTSESVTWTNLSVDDGNAPPPEPTLVAHSVSGLTSSGATVQTQTENAPTVRLDVATDSGFAGATATTEFTPGSNGIVNHVLTGLLADTTYYYRAVSGTTVMGGGQFTTLAAETVTDHDVLDITDDAARVVVTTTNADSVRLDLATAADFAGAVPTPSVTPTGGVSEHLLSGLDPETVYYYRIVADGVELDTGSFTTLAPETGQAVPLYVAVDGVWQPAELSILGGGGGGGEVPPPTNEGTALRVDVGGPGGAFGGIQWTADAYVGGTTYEAPDSHQAEMASSMGDLAPIYFTSRYGDAGRLIISAPTDLTRCLVKLYMVEPTFGTAGRRRFAWHGPEGRLTEQIDLAESQGLRQNPLIVEVVLDPVDGVLRLEGVAEVDNPILAALEVLDGSDLALSPVLNDPAPPPPPPSSLAYSLRADLGAPAALNGVILPNQSVRVLVTGGAFTEVRFYIDKPATGTADYTVVGEPFVANGGEPITFSTGQHTVHAVCVAVNPENNTTLSATFSSPSVTQPPPPTGGIVTDGPSGRQAGPADRLARLAGVNTHFTYASYEGAGREGICDRIVEAGLRHVRDDPGNTNIPFVRRLGEAGVKWWVMYHGNSTVDVRNQVNGYKNNILSVAQYVDGLLGYNEPDNSGSHTASTIRQQQTYMYDTYRSDDRFDPWPITTWAATFPRNSKNTGVGNISAKAEGGDFHPYPAGARPETNEGHNTLAELDAMKDRLADRPHLFAPEDWDYKDAWKRGGSFYTLSETGWHNNISRIFGHRGIPEDVSGLYGLALMLWYDLHGFSRIHFYEMVNQSSRFPLNGTSIQGSFGLVRRDLSPKPLFNTIKNSLSTTLYTDRGQPFTPGTLDYTISGKTSRMLDTLHQRRDGTFLLSIWNGVTTWDDDRMVRTPVSDVPVDVRFNQRNVSVRTHTTYASSVPSAWTPVRRGANFRVPVTPGAKVLEIRSA